MTYRAIYQNGRLAKVEKDTSGSGRPTCGFIMIPAGWRDRDSKRNAISTATVLPICGLTMKTADWCAAMSAPSVWKFYPSKNSFPAPGCRDNKQYQLPGS